MKKTIIALASLSIAGSAQAALVAGWDFSQFVGDGQTSIDNETYTQTLSSNYTSFISTGSGPLGPLAAPFGRFYFDGSFGSSSINSNDGSPSATSLQSNVNGTGNILGFNALANLTDAGQPFVNDVKFAIDGAYSVVFEADLSSVGLFGSDWSIAFAGINAGFGSGSSTLSFEFSTNGADYSPVGDITLTPVDSRFVIDLPDVVSDKAYVRITSFERGTFIDDVAFNAGATAIPEPSSFAALAGLAILGVTASRRRRA